MKMQRHAFQGDFLVIILDIVKHGCQAFILPFFFFLNLRQLVDGNHKRMDGRGNNILIHPGAPVFLSPAGDADIGNRL